MAVQSWVLTDVTDGTYLDRWELDAAKAGVPAGVRVAKRTLRGGLSDGVDIVEVDNGAFRFTVLPTRGMGVWKAWHGQTEIGWKSPVRGPVHPQFVPFAEPSGLGWLDGFDELFVRCGLESNGAPEFDAQGRVKYPVHGRIANRPAQHVSVQAGENGEITVKGVVEETRFHFLKLQMTTTITTRPKEFGFRVRDEIRNLSDSPAEMQMLYHVNFGAPLLDGGSSLVVPLKTVVPRNARAAAGIGHWNSYAAESPGFEEQVYFCDLLTDADGQTLALLKNAHGTQGASLEFSKRQLACFTMWKNTTALADGYVTGIEPGTNFPNPRSYEGEQGRVVKLAPHGTYVFDIALRYHPTAASVTEAERRVAAIQKNTEPKVFDKPQPRWCAP